MSDTPSITVTSPLRQASAPKGYQAAREVRALAAVSEGETTPQEKKALFRLDKALKTGQPLRDDVPRGFYLNVEI